MAYEEWDSSLETGDEIVDAQHRNLYAIVNELHDALQEDRAKETVALVLVRVMLHAKTHFHDEEALMERIGYPDLAAHRRLHQEFEREADALADDYLAGAAISPESLVAFLHDWLVKHIGDEDRKIVAYLSRDRVH